jgi:pimeloyl-ACP methyl ester carboxylesterase
MRLCRAMKSRNGVRAALAVLLCVTGFILARAAPYRVNTVVIDAGGCGLVTDIVDSGSDEVQGSVVLLHGVAANKKIMSYLAYGFAQQNLRVFVPDLVGHARTRGPFSFARAETCADSLMRQLIARGAIDPAHTILAGHSMGGAIAVRVAARTPVAGVIAVSPAPMSSAHGVPPDGVLFSSPPATPMNTLVISGTWEPSSIRETARDLVTADVTRNGKYVLLPHATHVSLLFDKRVASASQEWAAETLHLSPGAALPYSSVLSGCLLGLVGVLLLSGPFIRETLGLNARSLLINRACRESKETSGAKAQEFVDFNGTTEQFAEKCQESFLQGLKPAHSRSFTPGLKTRPPKEGTFSASSAVVPSRRRADEISSSLKKAAEVETFGNEPILNAAGAPSAVRLLLEIGLISLASVVVLRYWNPLSFVRVFNGGYFASFLLLTGLGLLLLHRRSARALWSKNFGLLLAAVFAGLVLHLLVMGWFEVTQTETWLSAARWARFPVLFLGMLPYLAAEELLLGPIAARSRLARFALVLASRAVAWIALFVGILALHSGAILLVLLAPYFAVFCVLQRAGMDVVRKGTGSPMAAAIFGAILLAGFCLVIFPIT